MYFLDTCICVDFLRGRLSYGYKLMRAGRPEEYQIPAIVAAELWFGAEHSADPKRECAIVEQFLESLALVPFDANAAREYGKLRQLLGSKGQIIGDRDMMIAASALANGATLVTNNIDEFVRVPNLSVESWSDVVL